MAKGEFSLIDFISTHFKVPEGMVGIGDDCAIIPSYGEDTLVTTDMLLEGIHFLRTKASPEDIGWKAAAVNLSDIAAMGGVPTATFLSMALPADAQGEWAERFIVGYAEISRLYNVPLLGGDTTSSLRDIAINVGVKGRCPQGKAIGRNGAKVGETIFVTGPLGDSGAGLKAILEQLPSTSLVDHLIGKHLRPTPRLAEGVALRQTERVGAMMDISDGIASDLRHILCCSGVGATIELSSLPLSEELRQICTLHDWDPTDLALTAGEDYELLLTGPANLPELVEFPLHPIGTITEDRELCWMHNGRKVRYNKKGFSHF